jgi:hypothetical protein
MICIRCGANLWASDKDVICPYCKTINLPTLTPTLKSISNPKSYQPTRKINQPPINSETPTIGLGDAIAIVTTAVGIRPCGGCSQRKQLFNYLIPDIRHPFR